MKINTVIPIITVSDDETKTEEDTKSLAYFENKQKLTDKRRSDELLEFVHSRHEAMPWHFILRPIVAAILAVGMVTIGLASMPQHDVYIKVTDMGDIIFPIYFSFGPVNTL